MAVRRIDVLGLGFPVFAGAGQCLPGHAVGQHVVAVRAGRRLGAAGGLDDEGFVFRDGMQAVNLDGTLAEGGGEALDDGVARLLVVEPEPELLHDIPGAVAQRPALEAMWLGRCSGCIG